MDDKVYVALKGLYAKYNELNSLKNYTSEELTLKVIEAKQETINDVIKLLK